MGKTQALAANVVAKLLVFVVDAAVFALIAALLDWALGLSLDPLRVGVLFSVGAPVALALLALVGEMAKRAIW